MSTEEKAQSGLSLATQRTRIEASAVATDRKIDEMVIDAGKSAKTLQRPGIEQILGGIRRGEIGTLIVLKLDRLTRSVRDLSDLLDLFKKQDVALVSVGESLDTSSASGRMVTNMVGVISQWEREAIAERTAAALEQKRNDGMAYSRTPFGFEQRGKRLIARPEQQAALVLIREMHNKGASLGQIVAALTDASIAPARSRRWHPSSVKSIIDSRMYLAKISA